LKQFALVFAGEGLQEFDGLIKVLWRKLAAQLVLSHDRHGFLQSGGRTVVEVRPSQRNISQAHGMPMYSFGKDTRLGGMDAIGSAFSTVQPQNIEPSVARSLDATLLSVRMVVDIAKQSSSGNHLMGGFASVKTATQLSIMAEFTDYKFQTPRDGTAELSLSKHLNSGENIFEIKKAKDVNLDLGTLGGSNSGKVENVLVTQPETYARTVNAHLRAAHLMFMSVVKENL
jgi:hypothetical protein